tara:strand:- start:105 stop:287 length:183 start_codon:yes stop_codon:yes gene_type:complete
MNLSYHIYYSKEFKIYDLVIKKDNKPFSNYHIHNKKDLLKLINNPNYDYAADAYSALSIK